MKKLAYILSLLAILPLLASCSDDDDNTYSQEELEEILIKDISETSWEIINGEEHENGETYAYDYRFSFEKKYGSERVGSMKRTFVVYYQGHRNTYGSINKPFVWKIKSYKDSGIVQLTFEQGETMSLMLLREKETWDEEIQYFWYPKFDLSDDPFMSD